MRYPVLDISNVDSGFMLAVADDYSLAAVQEHASSFTLFFPDAETRVRAHKALALAFPHARISSRDVDDEDWARRSQQNLTAISVGRLRVSPPWAAAAHGAAAADLEIIIEPSTGFGTGHHATTRLCLAALQTVDLSGTTVIDIGTGSGVLALAARLLGAERVIAIDRDPDAVRNASDNLRLNPGLDGVAIQCLDLSTAAERYGTQPMADLLLANLTGELLAREAATLGRLLRVRSQLIVSGLLCSERLKVATVFGKVGNWRIAWEADEDGWTGMVLDRQ